MILLGAIVFLGLMVVGVTVYASYRIFGSEDSIWTRKAIGVTWLPVVVALIVAVSPVGAMTVDGYQERNERTKIIESFVEGHPELEQLVRVEKGDTWLFNYMNGGQMHTKLLIGGQYLEISAAPQKQE